LATAAAQLGGPVVPGDAGLADEQDAGEGLPVVQGLAAGEAEAARGRGGQQRLRSLPQLITDPGFHGQDSTGGGDPPTSRKCSRGANGVIFSERSGGPAAARSGRTAPAAHGSARLRTGSTRRPAAAGRAWAPPSGTRPRSPAPGSAGCRTRRRRATAAGRARPAVRPARRRPAASPPPPPPPPAPFPSPC